MKPLISNEELRAMALAFIKIQPSLRHASRRMRIDSGYLKHFTAGERGAGEKLAGFFGYEPVVMFKKKVRKGEAE